MPDNERLNAALETTLPMPLAERTSLTNSLLAAVESPGVVVRTADKFSYILAPQNMKPGDAVACGPTAAVKTGNTLPLSSIPLGTAIHNVELLPGKGGQMARSAGTACTLISRGTTPLLPPISTKLNTQHASHQHLPDYTGTASYGASMCHSLQACMMFPHFAHTLQEGSDIEGTKG